MTGKRKYTRRNEVKPTDQTATTEHQDFEAKMDEPRTKDGPQPSEDSAKAPEQTRRRSGADDKPYVNEETVQPVEKVTSSLGEHEAVGLVEEAIYAHDMQDVMVRFDTLGRKWTFRPDVEQGQTVFYIECAIPSVTESLTISNSRFGLDGSRDEVKSAIEQLDEVVR